MLFQNDGMQSKYVQKSTGSEVTYPPPQKLYPHGFDGAPQVDATGFAVGFAAGRAVGRAVGCAVGFAVGALVADVVGATATAGAVIPSPPLDGVVSPHPRSTKTTTAPTATSRFTR